MTVYSSLAYLSQSTAPAESGSLSCILLTPRELNVACLEYPLLVPLCPT